MKNILLAVVFPCLVFEGIVSGSEPIDLISLVDLQRDVVAGNWTLENGELSCEFSDASRIMFPYHPPLEYDYTVEFTLSNKDGNIAQLVSHGMVPFTWSTNAGTGQYCRLEDINGHSVIGNPTLTPYPFVGGQRYTSVVRVRNDRVVCEINGQVLVNYPTNYTDLSRNGKWEIPDQINIGLGGYGANIYHSATITPIDVVSFPDINLENAIRNVLNIESPIPITPADMLELTYMYATYQNIVTLTGLEYAVNLTGLHLQNNNIQDITVLSNLSHLTVLNLDYNLLINDISALSGLTNLTELYLAVTQISDISPLSELTNLTTLRIYNNQQLTDISALAGLASLRVLQLENNSISDISAFSNLTSLEDISLYDNSISDISALSELTTIKSLNLLQNPLNMDAYNIYLPQIIANNPGIQILYDPAPDLVYFPDINLENAIREALNISFPNPITTIDMLNLTYLEAPSQNIADLTGIEWATNLQTLQIYSNQIGDISSISSLVNLNTLNLSHNSISNITSLSGLINLTSLILKDNSVSDISALRNLTELTVLDISQNNIESISDLENMVNLKQLYLWSNNISDISVVFSMTELVDLDLTHNQIVNIDSVAVLPNLTRLMFGDNDVEDISAISGLTNLTQLSMFLNNVSDISYIYNLTNMTKLDVSHCFVSNIEVLSRLTSLITLELHGNHAISNISCIANLTHLEYLTLWRNNISDISSLSELVFLQHLSLQENPLDEDAFDLYLPQIQYNNPDIELYYDAELYNLTVNIVSGKGFVDPNSGEYQRGRVVSITAEPESCYTFVSWLGTDDDSSTNLTNTVLMTSHKTVSVEFRPLLQLIKPVGGEVWGAGSNHIIEWSSCMTGNLDISYKIADEPWISIVTNVPNTGQYLWEIPSDIDSDECLISVFGSGGDPNITYYQTAEYFTIHPITMGENVNSVWPTLGGNNERNGLSVFEGPELGCLKWQYSTGSSVSTSMVTGADNNLHITCEDGKIYTLDPNGTELWQYDTGSKIICSPSVGLDGGIYFGAEDGTIYALDKNGELRWTQKTDGLIYSAPAVSDSGKVYIGSQDGKIYGLGADGSELWEFAVPDTGQLPGAILTSPTIGKDGSIYIGGIYTPTLYALDPNTGSIVWQNGTLPGTGIFTSAVVTDDGTIYINLKNNPNLLALDPNDGSILWTVNLADYTSGYYEPDFLGTCAWSEPALGPDGTIYVSFDDPYLRAVNPDGSIKWVTRLGLVGGFTLTTDTTGLIYAASDDGSLYVVNSYGEEISRFDGNQFLSYPVIAEDGTIYLSDYDHTIWALQRYGCENNPNLLRQLTDINGDKVIDLLDFSALAADWLNTTELTIGGTIDYMPGDINRDSDVDIIDFTEFFMTWLDY